MPLDTRPSEYFNRFHEIVRTKDPDWVYPFVRILLTGPLLATFRPRPIDIENIPVAGPVILAPNHFSNFDHFLLAMYLPRKVRFMAKSELFKFPIDFILSHGGSFPVLRGRKDEEAIITAKSILERDEMLAMYAEGTRSRSGKIGKPKRGLGRIVLESGAQVVPVALHGTEKKRRAKRLRVPAKVTIQFGKVMRFPIVEKATPEAAQEVSQQVFDKVRGMYEKIDQLGRRTVVKTAQITRKQARSHGRGLG